MSEAQIVGVAWAACSAQCVIIMMCWWEANHCVCVCAPMCCSMCACVFTSGPWVIWSHAKCNKCVCGLQANASPCKSVWIAEEWVTCLFLSASKRGCVYAPCQHVYSHYEFFVWYSPTQKRYSSDHPRSSSMSLLWISCSDCLIPGQIFKTPNTHVLYQGSSLVADSGQMPVLHFSSSRMCWLWTCCRFTL